MELEHLLQVPAASRPDHAMRELALTALDTQYIGHRPLAIALLSAGAPDIERLYRSLREALTRMSLYSSRIRSRGAGYALELCSDAVPFCVNARQPLRLEEVRSACVDALIDNVPSNVDGEVLSMTVTPLIDGYAVGFSCSHVAGDVLSAVLLGRAWGQAYRGEPLDRGSEQRAFHLALRRSSDIEPRRVHSLRRAAAVPCPRGVRESIVLRQADVAHGVEAAGGSLHRGVVALLVQRYQKVLFATRRVIRLRTPVDLREVLPGLEAKYVGNAFMDAIAEIELEDVERGPRVVVAKVAESIARIKSRELPSAWLTLGEHGLRPTSAWDGDVMRFDLERDVVLSNLVGRLRSIGPDLGEGPTDICIDSPSPRSFAIRALPSGDIEVDVRL